MLSSIFNIFKIGVGPSSSHTVGPMLIANKFINLLEDKNLLIKTNRIKIVFFGSLAATGIGHSSDKAVIMGLLGEKPVSVDTDKIDDVFKTIKKEKKINLFNKQMIDFDYDKDLIFNKETYLPYHPNAMTLTIYDIKEKELLTKTYYSIGGGLVVDQDDMDEKKDLSLPYPFNSAKELIQLCKNNSFSISKLTFENEKAIQGQENVIKKLDEIWKVMQDCVKRGCKHKGIMPGGLEKPREAFKLHEKLKKRQKDSNNGHLEVMSWLNLYALAVNEENACGGRIVTAPTNGAAGIIPAVIHYMDRFFKKCNKQDIYNFLLTAGAIGNLYQKNASISGADVGCQGEVGVACSMAAAALTEYMGGTIDQIENAAEIAMEHNLGLTCDPVKGLVQIPCIERNAMGAVKAVNASSMALNGDGKHFVSLDAVIRTMFITGKDMKHKYKETSLGGLAVNLTEC